MLPEARIAFNFKQYDPDYQGWKMRIRFVPEVAHVPDEKTGSN